MRTRIHSGCRGEAFPLRPIKSSGYAYVSIAERQRNLRENLEGYSRPYGLESSIDAELGVDVEDLFIDMQKRETQYVSSKNYKPNASYIPCRHHLVNWMVNVGEQCNLLNSTVHVSIILIDKIFSKRDVPKSEWHLFATACISIAAKSEETHERCPAIPDLLAITKLSGTGHTYLSFRDGEIEVLDCLRWKLRAVPAIHFVEYFLSKGVIFEADTWQGCELTEEILEYVKKYAEYFCNLTIRKYTFQQYRPSHLAATIILASRIALQIEPTWCQELVRLTYLEQNDISETYHHVWSYCEDQFPEHSPRSLSGMERYDNIFHDEGHKGGRNRKHNTQTWLKYGLDTRGRRVILDR